MKTKLSPHNPFEPRAPHALVWQFIHDNNLQGKFLDYGAHDGRILNILSNDNFVVEGIGLDANEGVVLKNQNNLPSNIKLDLIKKNSSLDFEDNSFDVVTILGVIEHVHNQKILLDELYRVLKPGGYFIALVPGKSFFSFLDLGNWKFVFPKLHKYFYIITKSKEEYYRRYVICENGLIGDVEVEKGWHQHFSHQELQDLTEASYLSSVYQDGRGLFFRAIIILNMLTFNLLSFLFNPLLNLDSKLFSRDELIICCRKD